MIVLADADIERAANHAARPRNVWPPAGRRELTAAGLQRTPVAAWTTVSVGPFTLTAVPAVDGTGDPQVFLADRS